MVFDCVARGFGWLLVGFVVGGLFGALLGYVVAASALCDGGFGCDEIKGIAAMGGATVFSLMAGTVCGTVGGVASAISSSTRRS